MKESDYAQYCATAKWADYNADSGRDMTEFRDDYAHSEAVVGPMFDLCAALVDHCTDVYDIDTVWSQDSGQIAHDLYLTRCGHGVGFWDRYHKRSDATAAWFGERLTAIADAWRVD